MHEQICIKFKAYEQMRMKINNNTKPNNKTWWSDKKQSLVHKVPSGVAILSHVCGVATNVLHIQLCVYLENMGG